MGIKASASVTIADISDGIDGTGIASTVVEYQAGSSGTTAPTGTWSTAVPATSASAPYLWTRVTYTYTDGSTPKVVYSVGSTPEGIEVGGRNLLLKSSMIGERLVCDSVDHMNSVTSYGYTDDGYHLVTPSTGNRNNGVGFYFNDFRSLGIYPEDTITFSLDIKGTDGDSNDPFISIHFSGTGSAWYGSGSLTTSKSITLSEEYKRVYVTSSLPNSSKFTSYKMWLAVHGNYASDIYLRKLKLEKGNKATDWTPAPEDVNSSIDNAKTAADNAQSTANTANSKADNAQTSANTAIDKANTAQSSADEANATLLDWCYNNNKVYINGSKIYAGTVSATQIAAKAVTADKLSVSTLSAITADLGSVTAGSINIGNGKFVVDSSGNLTSQYIVATGGKIGCWNISSTEVNNGQWGNGFGTGFGQRTGSDFSGTEMAFWAGNGVFRVNYNGSLYATNATITGSITATSVKLADEIQIKGNSYVAPGYTDYFPLINHANGNINFAVLFNTMTTTSIICPRIYTTDKSSGWITVLQGYAGINVMDAGASNGFNGLGRVKCTNGAWAMGALNGDSFNTFVLAYANETRLNSGENGYDASFWFYPNGKLNVSNTITISAGDMVVSNGWIYLANGMRLRTYNSSGTGANLIHWGTDNRIYIGEVTTKATKIRICQTCSNIGVLNSSGNWVTITTGVSDIREKNSIEDLQKSKEIVMGLKPKRFKFNDPEDDRYHLGFIAQDVRKTLDATIGDCAILEYNNTDPEEIRPVNRDDENTFTYSMRYNEIIPAHVGLTQEHEYRIESMDNRIENLQTLLMEALDKIAAQEKRIEQLQTS